MYISVEQSNGLDSIIKCTEVSFRSFISEVLIQKYNSHDDFKTALQAISISEDLIYSRKITAKLRSFITRSNDIYGLLQQCNNSMLNCEYNNDVPYVSEIIELLLIFFNSNFLEKDISNSFSSIEEFHYCCTLYHKIRNNLSHPASRPVSELEANKTLYFIGNIIADLDNRYFWYYPKEKLVNDIIKYNQLNLNDYLLVDNLNYATSHHNTLLCREDVIENLYSTLLGNNTRQRLAGSVVLYGYGGVGKTAITTEFLYRVLRDKKDGKFPDTRYLLFYSSKDEYLRDNKTTGELYLDSAKPEFTTLEELQLLICKSLGFSSITELVDYDQSGIVAIDNIENIEESEKLKILDFIKSVPRTVQFILTSRNEEQCEEKIHIREFKQDEIGFNFIEEIIESEGFNIALNHNQIKQVLKVSKGNALIILQALNIIDQNVSTFDELTSSLDSMRSKNAEMIASFMYKNTFDTALQYLSEQDLPVNNVMQIISLYDEKIELYSVSKLAKIDISDAEKICNYLLERLVLVKKGEYYELNEFAKRFVFIKLLPDRFIQSNIKDKIKTHKTRMKEKLSELNDIQEKNAVLHHNVTVWQPRNYIDKIVIAELFSLYGEAIVCVGNRDLSGYEKYLKDFEEHAFITNHPYLPLQKARLLIEGIRKFYRGDKKKLRQVEHLYEEAIESIEYDYRYMIGTIAHQSLLMMFGIFLSQQLKDYSRAIRYLELSKKYLSNKTDKSWFTTCNYLSIAYENKYIETNDKVYSDQLRKIIKEVHESNSPLDISRFKNKFKSWYKGR
ncbi:ATP-binding protein [Pseudoalteromonas sp. 10-33]|uniref:ATP-binding protein n=1 Tax=Pseudoalteromonas sp. 10-33 TaxID=1761890 RepID=UPI000732170A|nr:ATP-binding protein [Pseudoalteromonas sp. 10-33]KTF14405.1 hypothetical protein ATS76_04620 [Pseudoalteromonas sp. 10-33]